VPTRAWLLPPPEAATPTIAAALPTVRERLASARIVFVFLPTWRTPRPTGAATSPAAAQALGRWRAELEAAGLFPMEAAAPPAADAWLRDLLPSAAETVVCSSPLVSPEALVEIGAAMAAAVPPGPAGAVVAVGHLGGPKADPAHRAAFSESVLDLFRQGRGHQLPNLDPTLWLAGRPDHDLAHLFVLLGAAGGTTAAEVLATVDTPAGYAAILALDPAREPPPAPPRPIIPLRER
jgi:hypothetical protein